MVTLVTPKVGEDRYIYWLSTAFGPYDLAFTSVGEAISLPSELTRMTESKGIYHENNVEHDKVNGELTYHPFLNGMSDAPTARFPEKRLLPVYLYNGTNANLNADLGLAIDKSTSRDLTTSTTCNVTGYEQDPVNKSKWTIYRIGVLFTAGHYLIQNAYMYEMTNRRVANSQLMYVDYKQTAYNLGGGLISPTDWRQKQSFSTLKNVILALTPLSPVTHTDLQYWYKMRIPTGTVFSPSKASELIDGIIKQLIPDQFPIADTDYGTLAMTASKKTNANHVNMIAFLRDIVHPTEMIPKLRNLRNIKEITDSYLTVKYGILPTISDIRMIVRAFQGIKSYIDKNGFDTYSAGVIDALEQNEFSFTLEQHIKLAIGNDDSELIALIERLDSWGTLPTFQNLWDLLPYSFVVDWFVDVGGLLERVDSRLRLMRLDINYVTMSRKVSVSGTLVGSSSNPFTGPVTWEQYHRWVSDQCPVPTLSLNTTFEDFDHWLESGALVFQRL